MSKNYCTLYIARHGETEFNVKKILQGHCDSPLTANGLEQAKNLAEDLKSVDFDVIYSSDLLRAQRTAEIVRLERDLAITTTKVLRERYYGAYDGKPNQEYVAARDRLVAELKVFTEAGKKDLKVDVNAESVNELLARFINFLREISVANLNKREQDIICAISKGLVEVDINGEIKPSLAQSVEVRDEGVEYEFKIKKNIY